MHRSLVVLLALSSHLVIIRGTASAAIGGYMLAYGGGGNAAGTWAPEIFHETSGVNTNTTAYAESPYGNWFSQAGITQKGDSVVGHKPALHAYTVAYANPSLPVRQGAYDLPYNNPSILGGAIASWTDNIKINGENGVYPTFEDGQYLYFRAHVDGKIKFGSYANFRLQIGGLEQSAIILSNEGVNALHSFHEEIEFRIPAPFFRPFVTIPYYLELFLTASAFNDADWGIVDGMADFQNTAMLDAVYLGDADGNPLPTPGLRLVGDSGMAYDVRPVPEGDALSLVATAIVGILISTRRKSSSSWRTKGVRTHCFIAPPVFPSDERDADHSPASPYFWPAKFRKLLC